ncbi:MAG: DoxX family protein [Anaerolineae bacterium]
MAKLVLKKNTQIPESPIARFLFADTRMAIVWLIVRVYLGIQWLQAAQHKITDPGWTQTGDALKGFWLGAVATTPKPVIAFDWYRQFLQFMIDTQSYTWFSKVVVAGEVLVGVCLILGAFTGIAAFFGGLMNWNFMMAGSASTNPLLFLVAVVIILAWKTAGYYGLDRVLLPILGTPWKPGIGIETTQPVPVPVVQTSE